jgi:hypothetical protein
MKIFKLFTILLVLFTFGCSSKYVVTYDSKPQGASLICDGKDWGHTPRKLYYDESVKKLTSIDVSNCSANWVSGARESYPYRLTIFPSGGTITTVERPRGDGYATDASYGLQLRQTSAVESTANKNNDTSPKSCKKFGDLSGKVYFFDTGYCPYGYY